MRFRSIAIGRLLWWSPLLTLLVLVAAGCAENYPQTTLDPRGEFARMVDDVFMTTVRWAILVFVLVEGALVVAIIKFRGKPDDPEPKQIHGSSVLEVVWTVIPAVILVMVAIPTIKVIFETAKEPADALVVEVIGHQWWWEFRYPEYGITTANEMYVPVDRTVDLRMVSDDVVHSFCVPQFAAKRDVFPNRETRMWFNTEVTGEFPGQCAEFCGIQHARMGFRIVSVEVAEFDSWVAGMSAATEPVSVEGDSVALAGQQLFLTKACIGCHSFNAAAPPPGQIGPNLANIGSRTMIAAGMLENTDENMARWISDPQGYKEGSLMVIAGEITEAELAALVAYLRAQQVVASPPVVADIQ